MGKTIRFNEKGFSLLEVLIAVTLFAFFITAFLTSTGYNVSDSSLTEQQIILQGLAERKVNELLLDPPKFQNVTDNFKETKTFEESDLSGYEYTIELKKLIIPDFAQLFSQKDGSAMDKFAAMGASSNAYTSFTHTAYLFSCTD